MPEITKIRNQINSSRQELLDLSARNRLLNTTRASRSTRLDVVLEQSERLYDLLAVQKREMDFVHSEREEQLEQAEARKSASANGEKKVDEAGNPVLVLPEKKEEIEAVPSGHGEINYTDLRIQTPYSKSKLQKKLLALHRDAENARQEQGAEILYLALGFLKWYEDEKSDKPRYAPLVLLPVDLQRKSAASRFKISYRENEISTNLSLQALLDNDFGLDLPDISGDDQFFIEDYFSEVELLISKQDRWKVLRDDVVLWLFSFNKFLMYRDLAPEAWEDGTAFLKHPIISAILGEPTETEPPLFGENENIDEQIPPQNRIHVLDADSSQTVAIEEVRQGRNLVIQGPPGTGKSQTIANMIAVAVKEGKRVLFVAEKMAALEVVKRRLENVGLGSVCLELHSNKTRIREVLSELERTKKLGEPQMPNVEDHLSQLLSTRDELNNFVSELHTPVSDTSITPYLAMGHCIQLRRLGVSAPTYTLNDLAWWTNKDFRKRCLLVERYAVALGEIGNPEEHIWRGVSKEGLTPASIDRFLERAKRLARLLEKIIQETQLFAEFLQVEYTTTSLLGLDKFCDFVLLAINPSEAVAAALAQDEVWRDDPTSASIVSLVNEGSGLEDDLRCLEEEEREFEKRTASFEISRQALASERKRIEEENKSIQDRKSILEKERCDLFESEQELAEEKSSHEKRMERVRDKIPEKIINADAESIAVIYYTLKKYGKKWLRVFQGKYRTEQKRLSELLGIRLPETLAERLGYLEKVMEIQNLETRFLKKWEDKRGDLIQKNADNKIKSEELNTREKKFKNEAIEWRSGRKVILAEKEELQLLRISLSQKCKQWQERETQFQIPEKDLLGKSVFSHYWKGTASEWPGLKEIVRKNQEIARVVIPEGFLELLHRIKECGPGAERKLDEVTRKIKEFTREASDFFEESVIDAYDFFGETDIREISLKNLQNCLYEWANRREDFFDWSRYIGARAELKKSDLFEIAKDAEDVVKSGSELQPENILRTFQLAYYDTVVQIACRERPCLANFSSECFEKLRVSFRELDEERINLARMEVAKAHHSNLPQPNGIVAGQRQTVEHEINKKARHKRLRQLLLEAGGFVQRLKPVFMMSPLSIAQYLAPGGVEFDLLLIDEASQVRPADALGAIARARQVVVVGDDKQLPPTNFFGRAVEGSGDDNSEEEFTRDLESILGACKTRFPQKMLSWHYRSEHHSLIAVSNREFYDNRLFVVPSPIEKSEELGLKFHYIPEAVYEKQVNRIEAQAIADAVMEHAENNPNETLGVATFSAKQCNAILDELELRRMERPDLETFFIGNLAEPFFVKNLENIQGDERDRILISVCYGKDKDGVFKHNFGPLNKDGGDRRLNVLISRSKKRCEVFAGVKAAEIDISRTSKKGPAALKTFMQYAESGELPDAEHFRDGFDSPFEKEVARMIESHGYQVNTQVGVAGFFIDLAIVDPNNPGQHILGVECDGASYHSSRSARDRDRIRQNVLENRGWNIHRIWSTDWFQQPQKQEEILLARIRGALTASPLKQSSSSRQAVSVKAIPREIREIKNTGRRVVTCPPYQEANLTLQKCKEIGDISEVVLSDAVVKVVLAEGPIHCNLIVERIRKALGFKRAGVTIVETIEDAIDKVVFEKTVSCVHEDFYLHHSTSQDAVPVRDRSDAANSVRLPEHLPPLEIHLAILQVVRAAVSISRDELLRSVSQMFGYKSCRSALEMVLLDQIETLSHWGTLQKCSSGTYSL